MIPITPVISSVAALNLGCRLGITIGFWELSMRLYILKLSEVGFGYEIDILTPLARGTKNGGDQYSIVIMLEFGKGEGLCAVERQSEGCFS